MHAVGSTPLYLLLLIFSKLTFGLTGPSRPLITGFLGSAEKSSSSGFRKRPVVGSVKVLPCTMPWDSSVVNGSWISPSPRFSGGNRSVCVARNLYTNLAYRRWRIACSTPPTQIRQGNANNTKGTAFVVYEDASDAKQACDKLNGFNFQNRYLV
ncbi:hypothetical protein KEM55_008963, partial [Ascosphaera atra]